MPGFPPGAFKQLKEKIKSIFRRKKKAASVENDGGVIVDLPAPATAVGSGALRVPNLANPVGPALAFALRREDPVNPAQNSNVTVSHDETIVPTDAVAETELPALARAQSTVTPGLEVQ